MALMFQETKDIYIQLGINLTELKGVYGLE